MTDPVTDLDAAVEEARWEVMWWVENWDGSMTPEYAVTRVALAAFPLPPEE